MPGLFTSNYVPVNTSVNINSGYYSIPTNSFTGAPLIKFTYKDFFGNFLTENTFFLVYQKKTDICNTVEKIKLPKSDYDVLRKILRSKNNALLYKSSSDKSIRHICNIILQGYTIVRIKHEAGWSYEYSFPPSPLSSALLLEDKRQ